LETFYRLDDPGGTVRPVGPGIAAIARKDKVAARADETAARRRHRCMNMAARCRGCRIEPIAAMPPDR
jgi:hypothetical protein